MTFQSNNNQKSKLDGYDVAWNESKFFYIFIHELNMDYKEAYYMDNWNIMYKSYKLKLQVSRPYIKKCWTTEEEAILENNEDITSLLSQLRNGESDAISSYNNNIYQEVVALIENKIKLLDLKMAEAGLYVLMNKKTKYKPAALATDDF